MSIMTGNFPKALVGGVIKKQKEPKRKMVPTSSKLGKMYTTRKGKRGS